jgi:hypothetical protein
MPHQGQVIRDAVITRLTGATVAEDRVYPGWRLPIRKRELPAILVRANSEAIDDQESAPRELNRVMDLEVVGLIEVEDDGNALYDLLAEIETAMHADPYFSDEAADSILEAVEFDVQEEGHRLVGAVQASYAVTYQTLAPEAPTDLDDFERAKATHNLGGDVHQDIDAEDEFVVEAP